MIQRESKELVLYTVKPALGCVNVNMSTNIEFDDYGLWAIDFQSVVHRSLGTPEMLSRCPLGSGKILRNYLLFEIILTFAYHGGKNSGV